MRMRYAHAIAICISWHSLGGTDQRLSEGSITIIMSGYFLLLPTCSVSVPSIFCHREIKACCAGLATGKRLLVIFAGHNAVSLEPVAGRTAPLPLPPLPQTVYIFVLDL